VAVPLASGLTYLVYKRLPASSGKPATTHIVAAAGDLPAGITLAAKDLKLVNWPNDVPLAGSFSKIEEATGRPLIFSLKANEPVLARDLAAAGAGIGLPARIPPGMRATAVRVNEIVGVAGFLYPGSHVDVLATLTPPGGTGPLTETILQDVEVLTAGQTSEPDSQGKPQSVNVVTLLLSPQDSQKLLLTSTQGSIQFVLRSGADKSTAEIAATRLDQVLGMQQAPQAAPAGASKARSRPAPRRQPPPAAAPPPREPQVMEVIQGTQRTVQKFPE